MRRTQNTHCRLGDFNMSLLGCAWWLAMAIVFSVWADEANRAGNPGGWQATSQRTAHRALGTAYCPLPMADCSAWLLQLAWHAADGMSCTMQSPPHQTQHTLAHTHASRHRQ